MERQRRRRAADVEAILRAAIDAADPARAVRAAVARAPELRPGSAVRVVAIGKAAVRMWTGALDALRTPVRSALIVAPHDAVAAVPGETQVMTAAHPLPDESSLRAGRAVADVLRHARREEVVLVLLSGGASSLCVLPVDGVALGDYARIIAALMRAGADIHELNTVRRQLDVLKGGGMAALAAPAHVLGFVISDVPGDDPAVIASGPLTAGGSGPDDALRVLRRYGIGTDSIPAVLESEAVPPAAGRVEIVLRNADALRGAAEAAERLGYDTVVLEDPVTGEARRAGEQFAVRMIATDGTAGRRTCVLAGGETTVIVRGSGRGGRNHEFALAAALALPAGSRIAIGAAGTDGIDGTTDAAGAVVDYGMLQRAERLGLRATDALEQNDSGSFLQRVGAVIRTGPTGTNVMDVMAAAVGPY